MPGATPTYGLPYQTLTDAPHGPTLGQDLAEAVETELARIDNPPVAHLRQTVAQSLATANFTAVTFDAEDVDTHNGHSTSSNTSRYTCQVAGVYELSGGVGYASNATGIRVCAWYKNGSEVAGSHSASNATASSSATRLPARTILVTLAVGDYVELIAYQNSGAALNTEVTSGSQSSMSVRRVGA